MSGNENLHIFGCFFLNYKKFVIFLTLQNIFCFFSPFSLPFVSPHSYLSLLRPQVVPAESHETWTLSHEMKPICKSWGKIAILLAPEQPFRTKLRSIGKNCVKIATLLVPETFARNEGSIGKHWTCAGATLSHEMRVNEQKMMQNSEFTCARATLSHEMRRDPQKLG